MRLSEQIASELQFEAATTRRMLERVPEESFDWKPHEKSTALGRLAGHIAELPSLVGPVLTQKELDFNVAGFKPFIPSSVAELLERFDRNIASAVELLKSNPDDGLSESWRLRSGEQVLFESPRAAVLRSMALNHIVHHRGQLSVYLRLLNVPLPPVYGPTADEGPRL